MPLLGDRVDFSIELSHADSLRIKDGLLNRLKSLVLAALLIKSCHGVLKHIVASGLSTSSWPDKHDSESHIKGFEELNDFQNEYWMLL